MVKFNNKTVLISMLDWGFGHTTRCITIIKALQMNHMRVAVACNIVQQKIIAAECTNIEFYHIKGYNIQYSRKKWLLPLYILLQLPKIAACIYKEHIWLQKWLQKNTVHYIISDNRFGFYSKKVPSIFITHQLTIKTPFGWLTHLVQKINYGFINKFHHCWVPDIEEKGGLAGLLSHPKKKPAIPVHYIGWLSRFSTQATTMYTYKFCVLLSGPEPQRTILENTLLAIFNHTKEPVIFISGKNHTHHPLPILPHIKFISFANATQLQTAFAASEFIICRGGYTSLMELLPLQKKLIVVPTPGQTEQEYLGEYLQQQYWAACIQQNKLTAHTIQQVVANFTYAHLPIQNSNTYLQKAIINSF